MPQTPKAPEVDALIGHVVVLDLSSPYVCIGTLSGVDDRFFRVLDADFHDFRDSPLTRENYVFDSVRLGIRRNRKDVLVRREEVVAITRFSDLSAS